MRQHKAKRTARSCVRCWLRKWLQNVSVEFSLKKYLILVGGVLPLGDIAFWRRPPSLPAEREDRVHLRDPGGRNIGGPGRQSDQTYANHGGCGRVPGLKAG